MFGKLFGYLALIRTGKLEDDEENVVAIFDRLVDLHKRKGWIREVVCEAVLTLLAAVNGSIVTVLIPRLKLFLDTEVQEGAVGDMAAWQVMLCVGIQHLMVSKGTGAESVKAELATLLPHADLMVPKHFQEMIPTLIEATGGFPKVRLNPSPLSLLDLSHYATPYYVMPCFASLLTAWNTGK